MQRKDYFILFLISLLVRGAVGWMQKSPGFMDAEYYFIGGRQLAEGAGFSEPILWNYLDDPSGIPHPSHGYWMPLTSLLAAAGMLLTQNHSFAAAQWVFILLGSLIPPLTAWLGYLLSRDRTTSLLAGGLAIFAAFYLPYLSATDTFGIYAILGALFFILLSVPSKRGALVTPILLGLIAGLMHLARADGLIWLGFAWIAALLAPSIRAEKSGWVEALKSGLLTTGGYLVVMAPWFTRNWQVFGSLLAPGGSRSLWITSYNELFLYPASQLTLERWLSSGVSSLLEARTWAMGINLQRSIAEQGMIFLTPLILLGLWSQRRDFRLRLAGLIWVCTFTLMTFVFPYQGARGGFFHSSAALLPILWASAPIGLDRALQWASQRRGWNFREARIVFGSAMLFFAIVLSVFTVFTKINGSSQQPGWEKNSLTDRQLEEAIQSLGAQPGEIVLTINPPGYFAYTNRPALAIPDGGLETTLAAADQFGGRYLLLEPNHPEGLNNWYAQPQTDHPQVQYLATVAETHIFRIK